MFGITRHLLPAEYTGLSTYVRAICESDILTVSAAARHIATQIFAPSRDLARCRDLHGDHRRYASRATAEGFRSSLRRSRASPQRESAWRHSARLPAVYQRVYVTLVHIMRRNNGWPAVWSRIFPRASPTAYGSGRRRSLIEPRRVTSLGNTDERKLFGRRVLLGLATTAEVATILQMPSARSLIGTIPRTARMRARLLSQRVST